MKVLFIIPSNEPPVLEGNFSPRFKDFVAQCLRKSPTERPTALELLQHPFIRSANHVSHLTDLLERNQIASDDRNDDEDFASSGDSSIRSNLSRSMNGGERSQFVDSSNSGSSSVFAMSGGNGFTTINNSMTTTSCSTELGSFSHGGADTVVGGYLETSSNGGDHDRFARSKVHTRAKSTSVDSGWDFNTIRISSSTTTTATTTATVSSSAFFARTLETVETPSVYEAHVGYSEEIVNSSSAIESSSENGDNGGDGNMDEDEEVFENIVKPAIFDVLGGAMDAEPLDEEDEAAATRREELLFDFLHAFESLNQEKGLLSKVLNSLLVNGSQQQS